MTSMSWEGMAENREQVVICCDTEKVKIVSETFKVQISKFREVYFILPVDVCYNSQIAQSSNLKPEHYPLIKDNFSSTLFPSRKLTVTGEVEMSKDEELVTQSCLTFKPCPPIHVWILDASLKWFHSREGKRLLFTGLPKPYNIHHQNAGRVVYALRIFQNYN